MLCERVLIHLHLLPLKFIALIVNEDTTFHADLCMISFVSLSSAVGLRSSPFDSARRGTAESLKSAAYATSEEFAASFSVTNAAYSPTPTPQSPLPTPTAPTSTPTSTPALEPPGPPSPLSDWLALHASTKSRAWEQQVRNAKVCISTSEYFVYRDCCLVSEHLCPRHH